jgi:hypothetical protein
MPHKIRWQDALLAVGGVYVFVTPWIFDFTANADASWTLWVLGGAMVLLGLAALVVPQFVLIDWAQALVGVALFVSPWVMGFDAAQDPSWNAWIAGPIAVILAAWAIYDARGRPAEIVHEVRYPKAA